MSVSNEAEFIAAVTIGSAIECGVYSVKYTIVTSHCTWWVEGGDLLELMQVLHLCRRQLCSALCKMGGEYNVKHLMSNTIPLLACSHDTMSSFK